VRVVAGTSLTSRKEEATASRRCASSLVRLLHPGGHNQNQRTSLLNPPPHLRRRILSTCTPIDSTESVHSPYTLARLPLIPRPYAAASSSRPARRSALRSRCIISLLGPWFIISGAASSACSATRCILFVSTSCAEVDREKPRARYQVC
jgi:hypothetical protein